MNHYTGQPGSYIQIRTVADFEVKEVTVTNQNTDGTQVESGSVTLREGSMWWRYTATVVNDLLEGDKT